MSKNDNAELFGADSLPFESLEEEVRADVEDVQIAVLNSGKKATTDAYKDIAVVATERVSKGTVQVKNLAAGDLVSGETANLVQTRILGSNDGGKTFEFTVLAEETGTTPANSTATGVSRLLNVPHVSAAGVPDVLTHYKVQAKAHAAGAQGTVVVKGAFSMQG